MEVKTKPRAKHTEQSNERKALTLCKLNSLRFAQAQLASLKLNSLRFAQAQFPLLNSNLKLNTSLLSRFGNIYILNNAA